MTRRLLARLADHVEALALHARGRERELRRAAAREPSLTLRQRRVRSTLCSRANEPRRAESEARGNQQKIVLAREIERNPDLLLIGQPTRGVDIGAIEFIHQQIVALRDQGKAILLVSVELEEILSLSDRIAVMFDGKMMGERMPENTDEKELGLLMAGMNGETA